MHSIALTTIQLALMAIPLICIALWFVVPIRSYKQKARWIARECATFSFSILFWGAIWVIFPWVLCPFYLFFKLSELKEWNDVPNILALAVSNLQQVQLQLPFAVLGVALLILTGLLSKTYTLLDNCEIALKRQMKKDNAPKRTNLLRRNDQMPTNVSEPAAKPEPCWALLLWFVGTPPAGILNAALAGFVYFGVHQSLTLTEALVVLPWIILTMLLVLWWLVPRLYWRGWRIY